MKKRKTRTKFEVYFKEPDFRFALCEESGLEEDDPLIVAFLDKFGDEEFYPVVDLVAGTITFPAGP